MGKMEFIQTQFKDNHSLVQVSGGSPTIRILVNKDGSREVSFEDEKSQSQPNGATFIRDVLATSVPKELDTTEAREIWARLQNAGFVDSEYQPIELNKAQKMFIADCMSDALRLRYKWIYFENLWNEKHLAQTKIEMLKTGIEPERAKEIQNLI